jgi:hypothetical protein
MRRPAFIEIDGKAVPALTGLCRVAAPFRRGERVE